jgi:hypothetical protein
MFFMWASAALAQDTPLTLDSMSWLNGLAVAGAGLAAVAAGAAALYRYLLRGLILDDVNAALVPLTTELAELQRQLAELQRQRAKAETDQLSLWGTTERGLLADMTRLADAGVVSRIEALEIRLSGHDDIAAEHYAHILREMANIGNLLRNDR